MNAYAASWPVLLRPLLFLIGSCSLFIAGSCSPEAWHFPQVLPKQQPGDTVVLTLPPGTPLPWAGGKLKAGTIIITAGDGNTVTSTTKAKGQAVNTAPGGHVEAKDSGGGLLPYGIGAAVVVLVLVVWKVARTWGP